MYMVFLLNKILMAPRLNLMLAGYNSERNVKKMNVGGEDIMMYSIEVYVSKRRICTNSSNTFAC
jgi:hypothetical protein